MHGLTSMLSDLSAQAILGGPLPQGINFPPHMMMGPNN
jgi:hypothetical protein